MNKIKLLGRYLVARVREPSTLAGLAMLCGVVLDQQQAAALAAVLAVLLPEGGRP